MTTRTVADCRRGSDEMQQLRAAYQRAGNAYDDLASSIQSGDEAEIASDESVLTEALAALPGHVPAPAPARPEFTAEERVVLERGKRIAASVQQSRAVRWIREFLPIVARRID
jgi:hypothetical protein